MAYFSNSTDGDILEQQCAKCPAMKLDGPQCPIRLVQDLYNYDQLTKGNEKLKLAMELLIDAKGICQMKPIIDVPTKPKGRPPAWLFDEEEPHER